MICKFRETIKKHNMLSMGDTVVIGLSGGADSVTLLHLLNELKDEFSLNLIACHVNHLIRGDEANRDMNFVKEICNNLNIPLEILVVDVKNEAKKFHESVEECGRRIRYDFFSSVCKNGKIATAHNLCDNEETVILNLSRGTGLAGLKGIPYVRDNIIRPLLDFSRQEIEKYCEDNNISYVIDSTNCDEEYKRNFVRHSILTKIKELEPSFDRSFSNFVSIISDDFEFLDKSSDDLIEKSKLNDGVYDVNVLLDSHRAALSRALYKLTDSFSGVSPEKKHIDILIDALNSNSKKVQITGGVFAVIKNKKLYFTNEISNEKISETEAEIGKSYDFFDFKICISHIDKNSYFCQNSDKSTSFSFDIIDFDKIAGKLILRSRQEGDRISLQKRNVSKTLKKLFCEDDIPVNSRDKIPVISDDNGVVWVYGYGCDKRCVADEKSQSIIKVEVK